MPKTYVTIAPAGFLTFEMAGIVEVFILLHPRKIPDFSDPTYWVVSTKDYDSATQSYEIYRHLQLPYPSPTYVIEFCEVKPIKVGFPEYPVNKYGLPILGEVQDE